jgi:hypothetical protein
MTKPDSKDTGLEYYTAVGHALTEFSLLENVLCRLFVTCVTDHSSNLLPAYSAFWAVVSFEGKVKMTGPPLLPQR